MSLDGLMTGLTGVGPSDVVDFDMCLMAGYETLEKLDGLSQYAVFSEAVVPGEGNPYTSIIDRLQANPSPVRPPYFFVTVTRTQNVPTLSSMNMLSG